MEGVIHVMEGASLHYTVSFPGKYYYVPYRPRAGGGGSTRRILTFSYRLQVTHTDEYISISFLL